MRVFAGISLCALTLVATATTNTDHTDAALRQLHDATKTQRNGRHLLNLASLRSLQDVDLRPFFYQFAQHRDWTVQVHAVLGLAELSDEKVVDPWLVQQIAPSAREHLIAQALDDELLKQEQMEALIKWPLLEPTPRLLLLAELRSLNVPIDEGMVKELVDITDLSVAIFAALLLGDSEKIEGATRRLRRAVRTDRNKALHRTLQLIRQYKVQDASPWLMSLLEDDAIALSDKERYWTLFALLTVDKDFGLEIWNRAFSLEPERIDQVRYLLLLLESGIAPTPQNVQRLKIDMDDPLLGLMVRSGNINDDNSRTGTAKDVQAMIELVEQGHRDSINWVFRVAEKQLSIKHAKSFYQPLSRIPESSTLRRNEVAVRAFVNLIRIAPEAAWVILRDVEDDSLQQELLLFAMLQGNEKDAVNEAAKLRRIGVNKADVMTLLLIARGSEPLQLTDQKYLGIIAAGGGHVSPALETQAAWLYLKGMGLADKALAAVSTQ